MASHPSISAVSAFDESLQGDSMDLAGYETQEEDEDVDQLDSDTDVEQTPASGGPSSASTKKPRSRKSAERKPGHTLLPAARVENILHADGMTGVNMSKEALFMVSIATEEFLKRLAQAGHHRALSERRSTITYHDMAMAAQEHPQFALLQDAIPLPLPLSVALERRSAKEKAILEEDPATSNATHTPHLLGHNQTLAVKAKSKPKPSTSKDKANGVSAVSKEIRQRDNKGRWSTGGSANGETSQSGSPGPTPNGTPSRRSRATSRETGPGYQPPMNPYPIAELPRSSLGTGADVANGISTHGRPPSWSSMPPPDHIHGSPDESDDVEPRLDQRGQGPFEERWPGQYTGPASGFLGLTQDPGRTIYSQRRDDPRPR
ncbi:hypothetical protein JAAARDRAFT_203570 [Jaapia argillacea MUCL 33604]|uniref:Transcription factor CBF/NF-Y/archaeal histone domain-containing protein n=1 Tax=Jaapia argillacea MUCL 33604 TaxID=933084 RepID=A0A067QIM8_9AGAM|nr:hypothetical protein JAAARDRAFT_203570 [Jaapia argillacea MUCL 33604]